MRYESLGNLKQADLNLYVCAKDEAIPPGARYGPVVRDSYIIECCTGGSATYTVNGVSFPFSAGDSLVLFPDDVVTHETTGDRPRYGYWCAVKGMKIASFLDSAGISSESPFIERAASPKILEIMKELYDMKTENDAGAELRRIAGVHAIFGEILRYAGPATDKGVYVQRAIRIMETRFADGITVTSVARDVGLDRSYFSTLFRKTMGVTPQEYLTNLRIKRACDMLTDGDRPINEIASAVGIAPEGFSRVFRMRVGVTPRRYRLGRAAEPDEDFCCGM